MFKIPRPPKDVVVSQERIDNLKNDVEYWNQWRESERNVRLCLSDTNFKGANLAKVNLSGVDLRRSELAGANLEEANLREADLREINFQLVNLAKADLSGANLSGVNLSEANLEEANLSRTCLIGVDLSEVDLRRTNLHEANFSGASFANILCGADFTGCLAEANLSGVNLSGADLSGVCLSGANLSNANLSNADLVGADLSGANLRSANLSGTHLSEVCLSGADLSKANFTKVDLSRIELSDINFDGTEFSEAYLQEADLSGINLSGANFKGVDLSWINLSDSDLSRADFSGADLSGSDLSEANFSEANLSGANLHRAQALGTNFSRATFTGTCLKDWNTSRSTELEGAQADYIYLSLFKDTQSEELKFVERRPHSNKFKPDEFATLFQQTIDTLDLIFVDGIDWQTFFASFQELRQQYDDGDLNIQAIEKKYGDSFVVRLAISEAVDKAVLQQTWDGIYEENQQLKAQLLRTEGKLEGYKEQLNDFQQKVLQGMSDKNQPNITNNLQGARIGNMANVLKDNASQNYTAEQRQTLAEASTEIQDLLDQLSQRYPTETLTQKAQLAEVAAAQVQSNKPLSQRIISALDAGTIGAIAELLNHPAAAFFIEAVKDWNQTKL